MSRANAPGRVTRASAGVAAAVSLAAGLSASAALAECAAEFADLRSGGTALRFAVEVADTEETRARGLMFREDLGRFAGMLFVYDAPQVATFWMENTPLPLDMLFFDAAGRVTRIHANAVPFSRDVIDGGDGVLFVLEINGGLASQLGIETGAELRHPAVEPALAAWPCPDP
ncbi:DUF192 domain-containing protein [soil metagenome]